MMMESLPMMCASMAFSCCALTILSDPVCNVVGPVKQECLKLSNIAYPFASLSGCATVLLLLMSNGSLSRH